MPVHLTDDQASALLALYRIQPRGLLVATDASPEVKGPKRRGRAMNTAEARALVDAADMEAALNRCLMRDGPRVLAELAPYCLPGDDPVEVLRELLRSTGREVEDGGD